MKAVLRLVGLFCCLAVSAVQAQDFKLGFLTLSNPYIRAMPLSAKVSSGYVAIHNQGAEADQLLEATSDAAARIEIHEMTVENEVMRMRPLSEGLALPAGETVSLTPGGYHLMIFEPKVALVSGETFPLKLHFAKAGEIELLVEIRDIAAGSEAAETDEQAHHHHAH